MKIIVCISHVPDTTTKIKFVNNNTAFDATGVQWIINPWDELALTRALELKEASNGAITNVTVINVGNKDTEPTIRKALAIGADAGIRINYEPKDSYGVAAQLAEYLKKNPFEVIICGIESSDYNGISVGGMLAELIDMNNVSAVSSLNIDGGQITLSREIDGGKETLTTQAPFLAVVQKGIAIVPRIPSMRGIMTARTKPLIAVEPVAAEALTECVSFELPKPRSACKMVAPDNIKELVNLLHNEAKVL